MIDPVDIELLAEWFNDSVLIALMLLAQTTVIMAIGLSAAFFSRNRGAVIQSAVLRITLIAVLVTPLITLAFHLIDVPGITIRVPIPRLTIPKDYSPVKVVNPRTSDTSTTKNTPAYDFRAPVTETERPPVNQPGKQEISESTSGIRQHGAAENIPRQNLLSDNELFINNDISETRSAPNHTDQIALQSGSQGIGIPQEKSRWDIVLVVLFFTGIILWFGYSTYLLVRLIMANCYIERLRWRAVAATAKFHRRCKSVSRELGIKSPVVLQSRSVVSPITAGIFRPFILLPLDEHTDMHSRREVFLHELTHIKRHDFLWNQLRNLGTVILPFHPLMWILSFWIEELADFICDDYVIMHSGDRRAYARNLAAYSNRLLAKQNHLSASVGFISFKSPLHRRIVRILDTSRDISLRIRRTVICGVSFICMCASVATGFINITNNPPFRISSNHDPRQSDEERTHSIPDRQVSYQETATTRVHVSPAHNPETALESMLHENTASIGETSIHSGGVEEQFDDETELSDSATETSISSEDSERIVSEQAVRTESRDQYIPEFTNKPEILGIENHTIMNKPEPAGINPASFDTASAESPIDTNIPVSETVSPEQSTASLSNEPEQTANIQGFGFTANRDLSYIKMPTAKALNVVLDDYENNDYDLSDPDERKQYNIFRSLEKHQNEPAWSPDGRWIAFTDYSRIWTVSSSGGEPKLVYENFHEDTDFSVGGIQSLCFSADGKTIMFQKNVYDTARGSEVTILEENFAIFSNPIVNIEQVNIETGEQQALFRDAYRCTISPGGTYIAFLTWNQLFNPDSGNWPQHDRLMLYNTETKELTELGGGDDIRFGRPSFNPDETSVIVPKREGNEPIKLVSISLENGETEQITGNGETTETNNYLNFPECSPDGNWILYTDFSYETGRPSKKLMVFSMVSGELFPLLPDSENNTSLGKWSPDGRKICYLSEEGDGAYIYIYNFHPDNFPVQKPVLVEEETEQYGFAIEGNYPNPFNPSTTISFTLPEDGHVELNIFNIMGQKVRRLVSDRMDTGSHRIVWDGCDDNGQTAASGIYFGRLVMAGGVKTHKMTLQK